MAGVHAQSLSVAFFFICLYLSPLPKVHPTVDCHHSHWYTTPFTCPVLPLFNHLITIVNMQHSLFGQPEDVMQNVGACVPVYATSFPCHIPEDWMEPS